jgi:hypothetical protein
MSKRSYITSEGLRLLSSSSAVTGQNYWIGYYALAYVPNEWKAENLGALSEHPLHLGQKLTKRGDMIYNIFQGDLVGTGYYDGQSDGSAGGNLFGYGMYDRNIKKHYRYNLDSNKRNSLLTWQMANPDIPEGIMVGVHKYTGTDGQTASELPVPAPIYYMGDITGKTSVADFFPDFANPDNNGSSFYPSLADLYLNGSTPTAMELPKVAVDYRQYVDSNGNTTSAAYYSTYSTDGQYVNSLEIPASAPGAGMDNTSWFAANITTVPEYGTGVPAVYATSVWKLLTISNYNRFHAPVSSIGHVLNSDLASRNMAKTTKFFPISNYKVINSETTITADQQTREYATAISISIDLSLVPRTKGPGFETDGSFDFDNNQQLTFFDKYDTNSAPFNSTSVSFKFNRIGLYAIPMRRAPYVYGAKNVGGLNNVQFEINPDEDPVLYAIIDWDLDQYMSDTGDGLCEFSTNINLNLQSPTGDANSILRDTTIFYNMYEDDAQRWYQNQLIANASISNAVTEMGLELLHIKHQLGNTECCTPLASSQNSSSAGTEIQNIEDAIHATNDIVGMGTGIRGSYTHREFSTTIIPAGYRMGKYSVVLGNSTLGSGDFSFITGFNNLIKNGVYGTIGNGEGNSIDATGYNSIENGKNNYILSGNYNVISSGSGNTISGTSEYSTILSGFGHIIRNTSLESSIVSGSSHLMDLANNSVIASGLGNTISNARGVSIISGSNHYIGSGAQLSSIISGNGNKISDAAIFSTITGGDLCYIASSSGSVINSGTHNYITGSYRSIISTGIDNSIIDASDCSILGGQSNYIGRSGTMTSNSSVIGGGIYNQILGTKYAQISNGTYNKITGSGGFCSIFGGSKNEIASSHSQYVAILNSLSGFVDGQYSAILSGISNSITSYGIHDIILSGHTNKTTSTYQTIINGNNVTAKHPGEVALFGFPNESSNNVKNSRIFLHGRILPADWVYVNGSFVFSPKALLYPKSTLANIFTLNSSSADSLDIRLVSTSSHGIYMRRLISTVDTLGANIFINAPVEKESMAHTGGEPGISSIGVTIQNPAVGEYQIMVYSSGVQTAPTTTIDLSMVVDLITVSQG